MLPVSYIVSIALAVAMCGSAATAYYYKGKSDDAIARAEKAEAERDAAKQERDKMEIALSEQEKAVLQAQMKQKVVYKAVKQEVEKDATSRDWFNSPVPDGMRRLLEDAAGGK